MSLATRCPGCGTVFRVQPTQLSASGGRVRCGRCAHVFDGVAALVSEPNDAQGAAVEPSPQLVLFEAPRRAAPPARAEPVAAPFLEAALAEPPRGRWLWGIATLAALLVLGAQLLLHFRTEVVVLVPEARPYVARACAAIGCTLRLPRQPARMAIESSDLQLDGRRDGVIVLNAVIRNQAPFAQEYPALELTLTDERDQPLARRVLLPADYLAGMPAARAAEGIAAGGDAALRIHLETGDVRAIGYRMYLFFP